MIHSGFIVNEVYTKSPIVSSDLCLSETKGLIITTGKKIMNKGELYGNSVCLQCSMVETTRPGRLRALAQLVSLMFIWFYRAISYGHTSSFKKVIHATKNKVWE